MPNDRTARTPGGTAAPEGRGPKPASGALISPASLRRSPAPAPDLSEVRRKLEGARGREFWRSLEELADTPELREYLKREFPHQAPAEMDPLPRRDFLKLMGAALALAGLSGCAYQPAEKIVPYTQQPEGLVPGKPLFFATAFTLGGYALGVLAESHMGRPTKIEGNPQHPASLGATDAFAQASLLSLYDPDRSQAVRQGGDLTTWDAFVAAMTVQAQELRRTGGAGLRILTETVTSPTLAGQLRALLTAFPAARWHQYDPVSRDNVRAGARMAFGGTPVNTVYRFDRAARVVSLDSDFLLEEPGRVRYARDFSSRRRVRSGDREMNRLYVVESTHTITGATADHRVAVQARQVEAVARALAAALGAPVGETPALPEAVSAEWVAAVARDLQQHRGESIVIAGQHQPPVVHALAHVMNAALGNAGATVLYTEPVEAEPVDQAASLRELVADMRAGQVRSLIILGGNPVYTAPADLGFREAMQGVPLRVHLGLYDDETSAQCQWHIPESHYLEAWSDARAHDGTATILQPLIQPLYDTHSAHEVVAALIGQGDRAGYDIVRAQWRGGRPAEEFEEFWQRAVHDGVVPNTAARPAAVTARPEAVAAAPVTPIDEGYEIVFRPDPTIHDGRFANNAWLQELPKPLTKLTWDNAAFVSLATAQELGLPGGDWSSHRDLGRTNGQMVEIAFRGRRLRVPLWIVPGHPDGSVTLTLGYGRSRGGKLANGAGFNAYALRVSDAPWVGSGAQVRRVEGVHRLVSTQQHFSLHGRDLLRTGTLGAFLERPDHPEFMGEEHAEYKASLYPDSWPSHVQGTEQLRDPSKRKDRGYNGHPVPAWGMVIDSNVCIGCNACVVACQAENNVPTVGKDQVARNREMHWIRIDTYFRGTPDDPEAYFQPMTCQHCENAPCEPVCPVEATSHSAEGINEQTYNRCVGTRYCSNNCPYKVRRFNFLQYSKQDSPTLQMMSNPDVTVRSRGVMEKCTYCIQRINEARVEAEKEERVIRDGDVVTACQQACPTQAIVFGNLLDAESHQGRGSRVRQAQLQPLNYGVLTELNTRPRTTYLAALRNPNPELPREEPESAGGGAEG